MMINLLPPDIKEGYEYAQRNLKLVRWIVAFVFGLVGLGLIGGFGWLYMRSSIDDYSSQVSVAQSQLAAQKVTETDQQVKDITSSFKLVVQVLSKEVLFSKLLKQIATIMPPGANLTDLTISSTQGALDVTADATDYSTATQVQVNLADPANKIFASADLENVSCSSSPATNIHYPCTVTVKALFAKNNPFLFINQGNKS
ncbi:MAG TPA: hypothetical protein VHD60_02900 [Candidatus Saccharimonadales bacterium]|nr:hypothetical protein [Candidatus Saccharimonadales bacterium]